MILMRNKDRKPLAWTKNEELILIYIITYMNIWLLYVIIVYIVVIYKYIQSLHWIGLFSTQKFVYFSFLLNDTDMLYYSYKEVEILFCLPPDKRNKKKTKSTISFFSGSGGRRGGGSVLIIANLPESLDVWIVWLSLQEWLSKDHVSNPLSISHPFCKTTW